MGTIQFELEEGMPDNTSNIVIWTDTRESKRILNYNVVELRAASCVETHQLTSQAESARCEVKT